MSSNSNDSWGGGGGRSPSSQWGDMSSSGGSGLGLPMGGPAFYGQQQPRKLRNDQILTLLDHLSSDDRAELRSLQKKLTYKHAFLFGLPTAALAVAGMEYTRRQRGKPLSFVRSTIGYPLLIGWSMLVGGLIGLRLTGAHRELLQLLERLSAKYDISSAADPALGHSGGELTYAQLRAAHRSGEQHKMEGTAEHPSPPLGTRKTMPGRGSMTHQPPPVEQKQSNDWEKYGLAGIMPPPSADQSRSEPPASQGRRGGGGSSSSF